MKRLDIDRRLKILSGSKSQAVIQSRPRRGCEKNSLRDSRRRLIGRLRRTYSGKIERAIRSRRKAGEALKTLGPIIKEELL
jgi:hypothetical protein